MDDIMGPTKLMTVQNSMVHHNEKTDAIIQFLRASRNGNLEKVIQFIDEGLISDINGSNVNGLNALHLAAKDGYVDIVRELLQRGANVNNATKKGNTALHIASLAGQREVIKVLLQNNANVNSQSVSGFTSLYMAAQENHDACVRLLLAKGADPNIATEDGFTPLAVAMQQGHEKVVAVLLEHDTRGKARLPALHIAAKKNDVQMATILLEKNCVPDVISKSGFTPLHIAAHYGNINISNLLIENGANVNFTAKHNITPLHVACKWGKLNIVKLLVLHGASIDSKTRDGLTPLHCASRSGHRDIIEFLLKKNAPIMLKTKNGLTSLHMTAQGEHEDAAYTLLSKNAHVDDTTVDYLTALHVAAHCGHVRVAKLLLNFKADVNARALNGFTPLHIACKKNRIKVVELLLNNGANISAKTETGLTPLHVASFIGCTEIVIYLIEHGAKSNELSVRGESPLHLAARTNQTDLIPILLKSGAQVDSKARQGQTPLHISARLGNLEIIKILLKYGADINIPMDDGCTPLHLAVKEGHLDVVKALIENNNSYDAVNKKKISPLHLAAKHGHLRIVELLLENGSKLDSKCLSKETPLHIALQHDQTQVAELLLQNSDLQIKNNKGNTPLHIAARRGHTEIVEKLLKHSADVNAKNRFNFSPLHLSAVAGNTDVANLLLEHGAHVDSTALNGLTPLHLCAQEDRLDLARIIIQRGANISCRTKSGYTPLHIAAHRGHIRMVKLLLENGASTELSTDMGFSPLHQAAQQGQTLIIDELLTHKADPNRLNNDDETPLDVAFRHGYVKAVDVLKLVTDKSLKDTKTEIPTNISKIDFPEILEGDVTSDSEPESSEDNSDRHQQYKYCATDSNLCEQANFDTVYSEGKGNESDYLDRERIIENVQDPEHQKYNIPEYLASNEVANNADPIRSPIHIGFLVSFLVDARGGAMHGCRHSGVRMIVPPQALTQPTRVTCRYIKPERIPNAPPLMEGEALVSRILQLSPIEARFLRPVTLEVPHFGSLNRGEREIIVLRSDNGENWREHVWNDGEILILEPSKATSEADVLDTTRESRIDRIVRIKTSYFPYFIALISRVRQEVHAIGPDGGTVSSQIIPKVQAIFPPNALTKKIRIGLQVQSVAAFENFNNFEKGVSCSPVVTVEPRRRKFHKAIRLNIPAPKSCLQDMNNAHSSTVRLLCSITGGQNCALWEDVTGSTPLAFIKDCISFTTTVSARFWLIDCQTINDASHVATELYYHIKKVPFIVKFMVFAKRVSDDSAKIFVYCMTDDKEEKTLEHKDYFTEIVKSNDVEILDNQDIYLEFLGNVVPVLKQNEQHCMKFKPFCENRLSLTVNIKDPINPECQINFMDTPQCREKICNSFISSLSLSLKKTCTADTKIPKIICATPNVLPIPSEEDDSNKVLPNENMKTTDSNNTLMGSIRLADICKSLRSDWISLAKELSISDPDIELIQAEYPNEFSKQAMVMLRVWFHQLSSMTSSNELIPALRKIGRSDIVEQCVFNIKEITNELQNCAGS